MWKNTTEAIDIYELLSENDYPQAQNALGIIYEEGKLIKRNYQKAYKLYKQSAENSYDKGQYNLARMYQNGTGCVKNFDKAMEIYKLSAEQGYDLAINAIKKLHKIYEMDLKIISILTDEKWITQYLFFYS